MKQFFLVIQFIENRGNFRADFARQNEIFKLDSGEMKLETTELEETYFAYFGKCIMIRGFLINCLRRDSDKFHSQDANATQTSSVSSLLLQRH